MHKQGKYKKLIYQASGSCLGAVNLWFCSAKKYKE